MKDLTISELKDKKDTLTDDIQKYIYQKVEAFKEETGYSPSAIDIHLYAVPVVEKTYPDFIVGECSIRLNVF